MPAAKKKAPKKKKAPAKKKRGVVRKAAAKVEKVDVAPDDSCLQQTAPLFDEMQQLGSKDLAIFNVLEVDRRIALLARFVIEAALRDCDLSKKERADIALRAINSLEGSKVRSELWVKDDTAPVPIDVESYNVEILQLEEKFIKMRERTARRRELAANAQKALEVVDVEAGNDSSVQ